MSKCSTPAKRSSRHQQVYLFFPEGHTPPPVGILPSSVAYIQTVIKNHNFHNLC